MSIPRDYSLTASRWAFAGLNDGVLLAAMATGSPVRSGDCGPFGLRAAACGELPKARDSHGFPARQRVGDGGEHDADQALGVALGHRRTCCDVRDEFVLVYLHPFLMNGGRVVRDGAF